MNRINSREKLSAQQRAERLRKLTLPKGAFQSQRAKTDSIDIELREMHKREEEFNQNIQRELKKLNFPLITNNKTRSTRPKTQIFNIVNLSSLYSQKIDEGKYKKKTSTEPQTPASPKLARKKKRNLTSIYPKSFDLTKPKIENFSSIASQISNKIPNSQLSTRRKNASPITTSPNTLNRLNSINSILDVISSVDKTNLNRYSSSIAKTRRHSCQISECIQTLCEVTQIGLDVSLETIVNIQTDSKRLNDFILKESSRASAELNNSVGTVLSKSKRSRYSSTL